MNKTIKLFGILLSLAAMTLFVACGDDEPGTIDDIIQPGDVIADGLYIVGPAVSTDTTANFSLVQAEVNAPDFGKQVRPGLFEAYVYLGTGQFAFASVVDEVVTTFGGAYAEEQNGDPDDITIYRGAYTEGGAAATVPEPEQLYHVTVDISTNQYILTPVDYFEIIGAATPGGWGTGTTIELKSSSADEVVFEGTEIVLRGPDQYKFRYNSNWSMNLEEGDCDSAVEPCLNYFTNFGGTISALVAGGSNLEFDGEDGAYTVTVTYTPGAGNSITASLERTGAAPEITFDPDDYKWGVIGDATAGGWDSDQNMYYAGGADNVHTWIAVVTFAETGKFKFRANDAWDVNIGGVLPADGSEQTLTSGGSDIDSPGAGQYYIIVKTADEGTTWTATMEAKGWGIIGEGSPQGNWDADIDMTADGFVDGVTTYSVTGDFTTAVWKLRAGDDWALNIGGTFDAVEFGGSDFTFAEAGNYTVVLSFDGENYSITTTKN